MKWKSHRECTRAIAEDLGLPKEPMLEGCVYPDRVGMKKYGKGVYIEGVAMHYPHHKETDQRIKTMILRLRKKILKGEQPDPFVLGCLCHLIQDRVVFPHSDERFEEFERAVAEYRIKEEWRKEPIPLVDGAILWQLPRILRLDNPNDPEAALKEGYKESLLILKSLLQDPNLPRKFQPIYEETKKKLEARKKLRYAYWLLTYLNPLAPLNALLDGRAISQRNIVKRYGHVKRNAARKGWISIFAALLCWGLFGSGPFGLLCLMPFIGQILTAWFEVPKELMRNLEWFNFEKDEAKR